MNGYRRKAHFLGRGLVCLSCGKGFASQGRLRRHLVSVPLCVRNWGAFEPDDSESHDVAPHLAPPSQVEGQRRELDLTPESDHTISTTLLTALNPLDGAEEAEVWNCVEEHAEPLQVLRCTVEAWHSAYPDSYWHQEVAENALLKLLLDPDVSAGSFPTEHVDLPSACLPWFRAFGFECSESGLCSPRKRRPTLCHLNL